MKQSGDSDTGGNVGCTAGVGAALNPLDRELREAAERRDLSACARLLDQVVGAVGLRLHAEAELG